MIDNLTDSTLLWPNELERLEKENMEVEDALFVAIEAKQKAEDDVRICEWAFRTAIHDAVPHEYFDEIDKCMIANAKGKEYAFQQIHKIEITAEKAKQENKLLREALEFYADEINHGIDINTIQLRTDNDVKLDGGKRAREVLASTEQEGS